MLQKTWYEISPIAYLIVSVYFLFGENKLGALSGLILLITASLIIFMRIQYRSSAK